MALLFLLVAIVPADGAAGGERSIYVSPAGNDAWSGLVPDPNRQQSDGPVATLAKARDLVRVMKSAGGAGKGAVHVYLRGGDYFLAEPLFLTPIDSGTAESPVIWSAYENEGPVISGGRLLAGWTHTSADGRNVWTAKLPADAPAMIRQLWLGGRRLSRCRWPKQGTLAVAGRSGSGGRDSWMQGVAEFRFHAGDVMAWPNVADGEAIVTTRWVESHLPIASIDAAAHVIHFAKRSVFQVDADDRFWIENIRETLSEPGEFYVDPRQRTISLIAPPDIDPNKAPIVAPRLANVVLLLGDPAAGKFIENVVFRGVSFSHTQWSFDSAVESPSARSASGSGPWDPKPEPSQSGFSQAALGVPAAIWTAGARNCTFENCHIAHVGTYGIELSRGCQKNRIMHCTLTDLGAGGVKIGETTVRTGENDLTVSNEVS
ncbi:MAG TPA: right-handed parallel beta-helix repeat-containing protein, partial [Pirellulales bacterium]|nr:right-handed parallel beta-helix repeat-containing protein [Pirellulales bacterium]